MFTISKPGHISRAGQGEGRGAGARGPLYQPWTLLSTLLGLARCKSTHIYTYLPISTRQRGAVLCGLRAGHGGGGVAGEGARAGGARRLGQLHRRPHPPPAHHSQHLQHRLAPRGPHRCPSQYSTVQYSTVQFNLQFTMAAFVPGRGPAQRESEGWWWSAICCWPDPSPGTYTSSYLNII